MIQVLIPPIMALVSAILGTLVGGFLVHKLTKAREILGSSELSVVGGIQASCDEEHSELVVGGVAVASGGASS